MRMLLLKIKRKESACLFSVEGRNFLERFQRRLGELGGVAPRSANTFYAPRDLHKCVCFARKEHRA